MNELSLKVFELSHTLRDKWVTGEPDVRSRFLELVCLNWQLVDGELVYEIRKPFDVLAEGLNSAKSRGERTSVELFVVGLSELVATIDAIEYYLIRPRVNLRHRARRSRAHSDTQGHELTAHDAER